MSAQKDYSPFTPGQPVPPESFVGRQELVVKLNAKVGAAASGRLQVAFISGERGIGKSSLMSFVRVLAEREKGLVGTQVFLGGVKSLDEAMRKIMLQIVRDCADKSWFSDIASLFGSRIKKVGFFGASIDLESRKDDLDVLKNDFAGSIRLVIGKFPEDRQALLLVLDDINGLAENAEFANWLKSFVDGVATSGKSLPLMLVLVGLEERRQSLIALQASLDRVLDVIPMTTWSDGETKNFFEETFGKVALPVDARALEALSVFAGGLPVLAHEIGEATFFANTDDRIDHGDAISGALAAADVVGRKYLQPKVFEAIRSPRYLSILRNLAKFSNDRRFSRSQLLEKSSGDEAKVVDNFLQKMRELQVIAQDKEGGPGAYVFCSALHQLYFFIEARRSEKK
ncbi:MAG: ATP-binding protein [Tagaea sp.]